LTSAELVILYEVDGKPFLQMKTWDRHQQIRAKKSKYPAPEDGNITSASICNQLISDDSKCPRNPIQSESLSESLSESNAMIADADAHRIQQDHERVLNAAEDAGFKMSNDVRFSLIALYGSYGLEKILDGFKACVKHGVPTLAYLEAVLKGEPKKQKPKVVAQAFPQRDYSEVDSQMMDSLAKEIADMNAREVG
jgi:hypothetical protein